MDTIICIGQKDVTSGSFHFACYTRYVDYDRIYKSVLLELSLIKITHVNISSFAFLDKVVSGIIYKYYG